MLKKFLPYILILSVISLGGLIFLEKTWIEDAMEVQRVKYNNEVANALTNVRKGLISKAAQNRGWNPNSANLYDDTPLDFFTNSIQYLSSGEIKEVITSELRKNNINLSYEYAIFNSDLQYIVNSSPGFTGEYMNKALVIQLNSRGNLQLGLYVLQPDNYIYQRTSWMITVSIIFLVMTVGALSLAIFILFKQQRVAVVKSDFINNMTHEFKTPMATIGLAADALTGDKLDGNTEKIKYFSNMIKDENRRMHKQVEKILEAAKLERNNLEINPEPLSVNQYVEETVNNSQLMIQEKGGTIVAELKADPDIIDGDEVHFKNIIFNLIDNAQKYSDRPPEIIVTTTSNKNYLVLKVKDNGIGMTNTTRKNIFEKFYRAHTGNLHNVKGFGLGLSYVKAVVDAHGGKIKVESILGKGSTFTIELPLYVDN